MYPKVYLIVTSKISINLETYRNITTSISLFDKFADRFYILAVVLVIAGSIPAQNQCLYSYALGLSWFRRMCLYCFCFQTFDTSLTSYWRPMRVNHIFVFYYLAWQERKLNKLCFIE